jgi:DNA mismatch repair protein MutH
MTKKLSIKECLRRLEGLDPSSLDKPGKNKGERGQFLESLLGVANGSDLKDLEDGELKTFTLGQSILATQLKHCLTEILEEKSGFSNSKVGEKLNQVIYFGFTRTNDYLGHFLVNRKTDVKHYQQLEQDYDHICLTIRARLEAREQLNTITGPNGLLQIRTKGSKTNGAYHPLTYEGFTLKNKGMAFYLCGKFGKGLLGSNNPMHS